MPTQVQNRPSEQLPHAVEKSYTEHDPRISNRNKNLQHKEALRLALGSILAPKRPSLTPSPRSSSGTASPSYFPNSTGHSPHSSTPASAPIHLTEEAGSVDHSRHTHSHPHLQHHSHAHTPSRLGRSSSSTGSPHSSAHPSPRIATQDPHHPIGDTVAEDGMLALPPPISRQNSQGSSPGAEHTRPHPTPVQPVPVDGSSLPTDIPSVPVGDYPTASASNPGSGTGTPKAKFFQTLQSKSAWDALIHGSFS